MQAIEIDGAGAGIVHLFAEVGGSSDRTALGGAPPPASIQKAQVYLESQAAKRSTLTNSSQSDNETNDKSHTSKDSDRCHGRLEFRHKH